MDPPARIFFAPLSCLCARPSKVLGRPSGAVPACGRAVAGRLLHLGVRRGRRSVCVRVRVESACQFIHVYVLSKLVAAPAAGSAQKRSCPQNKNGHCHIRAAQAVQLCPKSTLSGLGDPRTGSSRGLRAIPARHTHPGDTVAGWVGRW